MREGLCVVRGPAVGRMTWWSGTSVVSMLCHELSSILSSTTDFLGLCKDIWMPPGHSGEWRREATHACSMHLSGG